MFSFSRKPKLEELQVSLIGDRVMPNEFIASLRRRGYGMSEPDLLRCINENKSRNLVYYAVVGLRTVGTAKSLPVLKKMTDCPDADTKVCSVLAIGAIAGKDETEYYAELLDSSFRDKTYVMAVIWEAGDQRAYEAVTRLAQKVLSKKVKLHSQSDLLYITEYIKKYGHAEDDSFVIQRLLQLLPGLQS